MEKMREMVERKTEHGRGEERTGRLERGEAWLMTYTLVVLKEEAMDGAGSRWRASYRYGSFNFDMPRN